MLSDDAYIERIKRNYNRRHKLAIFSIISALCLGGFALYIHQILMHDTDEILKPLNVLNTGHATTDSDIEFIESTKKLAVTLGNKNGVFLGSASASVGFLLAIGIYQFIGSRRDKLLIKYYVKAKN